MCTHCEMADWAQRYITPWPSPQTPANPWSPWTPPQPAAPVSPWTRAMLEEFMNLLRTVKDMEDRLGVCPCEDASKLDFLAEIKERLDRIEGKLDDGTAIARHTGETMWDTEECGEGESDGVEISD